MPTTLSNYQVDTGNSAGTLAARDDSGNMACVQLSAAAIVNSGTYQSPVQNITTSATLNSSSGLAAANSSGGAIVITLPSANTVPGMEYTIKKIVSANTVTVQGSGSDNIDAANTYVLTTIYTAVTVKAAGVGQWWITGKV